MGSISSKSLKANEELDQLLDDEEKVEEEEELEEEIVVPKSTRKRQKIQQKIPDKIYVILNEAATYVLDGKVYKRHEVVEEPRSKLAKFKDNGWFSVRY